MQELIRNIDLLTKELSSFLPLELEYQQKLDKKIRLEFSYNSNHIEGNTLTYGETELLLIFGKTTGNHELREYEEMKAHDVAYELVKEMASVKEKNITEADIRNLNKTILVQPFWKEAITPDGQPTRKQIKIGEYKDAPNSVRLANGEIFHYATPAETPLKMHELLEWFRAEEEKNEIHPVTLAALLHYKFVRIHPFDDGNGRLARLLMNYVLLRNNLPPVIIKSSDKKNYLFALNQADAGDVDAFAKYIAEQLMWSLELFLKAAKGESIEELGDVDKRIDILNRQLKNKKSATLIKSSGVVATLIKYSFIPLFKSIELKCEKLKSNFFDFDRRISYRLEKDRLQTIGSKESEWEVIEQKLTQENLTINDFTYEYDFRGFKINLKKQYFGFSVRFDFNPYSYQIIINNGISKSYAYESQLPETEINSIVSEIMNGLLNDIASAANT